MRAYHGTSSAILKADAYCLIPPVQTGVLQEAGRKRRLDKVFATPDYGLAKIYAGRAVNRFGGKPVVLEVILPDQDTELDPGSRPGAQVLVAPGAWIAARKEL